MDEQGADLYSEINLIPLKEDTNFLIGKVDKLIKCDSFFYILDKDKTQSIYKYDHNGNPVKRFFKRGGSGDEYIEIIDFDIDLSSKEIKIFCVPLKILSTDTDFNDLGKNCYFENLVNNYFDRIVSWENKIFGYRHWDRTVAYIDPETGKIEECLHTRKMKGVSIDYKCAFFKTQNDLYFQSPGDDCIYKLQDDRFVPYITLDYKKKEASMKFYEENNSMDITVNDAQEYPKPSIYSIREKDGQLIIVYEYHLVFRICTYDIARKKYRDQLKHAYAGEYDFCFDNTVYGIENPDLFQIPGFHEFMKGVKYDFTGTLAFDEDFENPVIAEYILK
jgi:hypothetical protein